MVNPGTYHCCQNKTSYLQNGDFTGEGRKVPRHHFWFKEPPHDVKVLYRRFFLEPYVEAKNHLFIFRCIFRSNINLFNTSNLHVSTNPAVWRLYFWLASSYCELFTGLKSVLYYSHEESDDWNSKGVNSVTYTHQQIKKKTQWKTKN